MRQLKTPEEIMINFSDDDECPDLTYSWTDVTSMILAAQRDALECVAENVANEMDERIVASYILHMLP